MKKRGGRTLWLVYIDLSVPRSRGRILPRSQAVNKPTLQEMVKALEALGYKYEVYPNKKYPPLWYDDRAQGYVVVKTDEKMRIIAAKVAEKIKQIRG
ncbi:MULTISPECIES: signal recognition particle subunit SRP19/SEC65 family protein [Pyrobaculum]|uniref:Signal recognition particle 19 kDa protein n=2 Tax=Pyrobaculum arsenaticum TaxID=121277 RepID=SRP19_PYRAR|nr:signal recognition particle subunit SRP19/SEC65 family protein [Pyrobaculum arsenaticum]A4WLN0.1 RecName: Full=Signal recognition particle 19 kDa protein; Short=SRP19 [Pyrobaculum arsenaticum DSM 13514]ABP51297.1 signal recognition particle, subunit SRP19 (srp19) [Pyrobaculum arsenaticum DSM 13514]MCY0889476.1 signal recognition particle [Pyrobaculum arsenaticum]NYR16333.1 signal recognition particle [Pyrobaculum arsenaticum]